MLEFTPINIRTWSMLGSCGTFGQAAMCLPEMDDRIVMLTADLCTFSGLDRFKAKFPDRLYNFGIAEQNMLAAAAGFAREGFVPFATTYASFAATRCADQVKVNMGYMGLPVKLVGLTAGCAVGILGATHMCFEDIAFMRSLPNVTVVAPADCTATIKAVMAVAEYGGPVYLRLSGGMNNPPVYKTDFDFEIGKGIIVQPGKDVALVATGTMVGESVRAAQELCQNGICATVVDMHTVKPLDTALLERVFATHRLVVTVEEHFICGGLGSAIAEWKADRSSTPPLLRLGIPDAFPKAGSYAWMLDKCGLRAPKIAARVSANMKQMQT